MGTSVFIGLGANLGDAASSIRTAISDLGSLPGTGLQQASRLYSTPAWGLNAQPDFVNAVVRLETELPARQLLDELFVIEARHGRDRSREQRWGPRMLDLDLLLYGGIRIDEEGLQVPHPLMHLRGFVLLPLREIAGNIEIPGHGKAADLLASLGKEALSNIVALSVDNRQP